MKRIGNEAVILNTKCWRCGGREVLTNENGLVVTNLEHESNKPVCKDKKDCQNYRNSKTTKIEGFTDEVGNKTLSIKQNSEVIFEVIENE